MIYLIIFLYIVPSLLFFTECMDDDETSQGFQWVFPTFFWPIIIPIYLVSRLLNK